MKLTNFKANVNSDTKEEEIPEPHLSKKSKKKLTTIQSLHFQNSMPLDANEHHKRMMYGIPPSVDEDYSSNYDSEQKSTEHFQEQKPEELIKPEPEQPPQPPQPIKLKNFTGKVVIDFPPTRHFRNSILSKRPELSIVWLADETKGTNLWIIMLVLAIIVVAVLIFMRIKKK